MVGGRLQVLHGDLEGDLPRPVLLVHREVTAPRQDQFPGVNHRELRGRGEGSARDLGRGSGTEGREAGLRDGHGGFGGCVGGDGEAGESVG